MKIRSATVDDREAIVDCDHLTRERLPFLDRVLGTATCIVAEVDGRLVAYASLEYSFYEHGFISMVYVAEAERRRGIGRTLVEELAARCKTRKLFSSTNESNHAMQQLFTRLGFVASGKVDNLDPGDPELIYFRDLQSHPGSERA